MIGVGKKKREEKIDQAGIRESIQLNPEREENEEEGDTEEVQKKQIKNLHDLASCPPGPLEMFMSLCSLDSQISTSSCLTAVFEGCGNFTSPYFSVMLTHPLFNVVLDLMCGWFLQKFCSHAYDRIFFLIVPLSSFGFRQCQHYRMRGEIFLLSTFGGDFVSNR